MTLSELAELTADKLEKLTDKELEEILKPYYNVTRPELAPKKQTIMQQPQLYLSPQKRAALALMEDEGIDMSFLQRKRR